MSDFMFKQKPKRLKHLCCPPPIYKLDINSPLLVYKFPCKIKLAMKVNSSVGSSNHNACYTVANETLNAYGKWAGCPGGSGPGYSSTMRYVPNENIPGFGPTIGGSICNCTYMYSSPAVNISPPVISGNAVVGSTLTTTNGIWNGFPVLTFTYRWYRGGTTQIPGATNNTYLTQIADVGQAITCRVTGINTNSSSVAISNAITIIGSLNTLTITGFTSGIDYQVTYVYSDNTIAPSPVVGGSTIYRFFSTTTTIGSYYSTKSLSSSITYLVVAGGGGGGKSMVNGNGGGGGAGGVLSGTGVSINSGSIYQIQVGQGGAGQTSDLQPTGENGVNSSLELFSATLVAIGGGGGALGSANPVASGGSGGGSSSNSSGVSSSGGAGTVGQGSAGQNAGVGVAPLYIAGRGGGATQDGGLGGNGLISYITGSSGIVYAGGGGGGANNTGTAQVGGSGGGGSGGFLTGSTYTAPTTGTDFLGGGGGGGGGFGNSNNGAKGGSGTVIIRFPSYS